MGNGETFGAGLTGLGCTKLSHNTYLHQRLACAPESASSLTGQ
jgi:hypothetical protein